MTFQSLQLPCLYTVMHKASPEINEALIFLASYINYAAFMLLTNVTVPVSGNTHLCYKPAFTNTFIR